MSRGLDRGRRCGGGRGGWPPPAVFSFAVHGWRDGGDWPSAWQALPSACRMRRRGGHVVRLICLLSSLPGGGGGGQTRKRHTLPHPAQPRHTNYWAPRTRKRRHKAHRPQRPTERSDPTQHAEGRTGDCPGPRKETTTRRNVTQAGGGGRWSLTCRCVSPASHGACGLVGHRRARFLSVPLRCPPPGRTCDCPEALREPHNVPPAWRSCRASPIHGPRHSLWVPPLHHRQQM